jgi:hypothetical protein
MSTYLNGAAVGVATVTHQITRQDFSAAPVAANEAQQSDLFVNQNSPNIRQTVTLAASSDTTIAIPPNTSMVTIYLPAGNTNAITVRHTGQTVGWSLNPVGFFHASVPTVSTPASLLINNGGSLLANIQVWFD